MDSRMQKARSRRLTLVIETGAIALFAFFVGRTIWRQLDTWGWLERPTYAAVTTVCSGDVNLDSQRDIRDVVLIQSHLLGKKTLVDPGLRAADVNGDSRVDVVDIVRLTQHILKRKLLEECRGNLAVTPATLDFGSVPVGTSRDLTLNIGNNGAAILTISAIVFTNPVFTAVSPAIPFDLNPGAEQTATIRFSPAAIASHSGTATVTATSGSATMTAEVALAGAGVTAANPVPAISGLSPASAIAGAAAFTLTINGSNFMAGSVVRWDGAARATTYVNAGQVRASIAATDLVAEDVVGVSVFNPAPAGGASNLAFFTIDPNPIVPAGGPWLRYIAPQKAPVNAKFKLLGKGFSPTPSANQVKFIGPAGETPAQVTAATATSLEAKVPDGLASRLYAVTVTVGGQTSNGLGFQVTTTAPAFEMWPSQATLLLSPGTGKEYLLLSGGTPPYSLKPLAQQYQSMATVELKGDVVEVTGLAAGDVTIEAQDSASTPALDSSTVRVQSPRFNPDFEITPHGLLAGSSPGFDVRVSTHGYDMRLSKVKIKSEGCTTQTAGLTKGSAIATEKIDLGDYHVWNIVSVDAPDKLRYEVRRGEGGLETIGSGAFEKGAVTLQELPEPPREGVVPYGIETDTLIRHGLWQLPAQPGESFTVTATLTSVTVDEGRNLPMTRVVSRTFRTVAPAAGAPSISFLYPPEGQIGKEIRIRGTGFSADPSRNQVTFPGNGAQRLAATVKNASASEVAVFVPYGAVTGPVRVTVDGAASNDYLFHVLFRPEIAVGFPDFTAGASVKPIIWLDQPSGDVAPVASAKVTL
ncbi:MAG: choice-of-anchor D domain-containing protein, partial [Acidobacteria bacterium]